jgi:hypothetical protein
MVEFQKFPKITTPSKLWVVASISELEKIKKEGIKNYGRLKLIHNQEIVIDDLIKIDGLSTSDYFGFNCRNSNKELKYLLIEIDPKCVENSLKRCNTEGLIVSNNTYVSSVWCIDPENIIGYNIRTIDLNKLFYFNDFRIRLAMFKESIQNKSNTIALAPKFIAHNNRIYKEKQDALYFNEMLIQSVVDYYSEI